MESKKINAGQSFTVLVAPLDWGLGHATRCIPVINELLRQGCRVILAGSGATKALLQKEFPHLTLLHLKGYHIQYASTGWRLPFVIAAQVPKLLLAVQNEHRWLKKVAKEYGIDAVISDNRYGLHHPYVVSVFITHQLQIKTPWGWMETLLQRLNYGYINRFEACWVPDAEGEENLGGALSHPKKNPAVPVSYLGPLSRFVHSDVKEEKHLLIALSGPEPQRTLLEQKLIDELKSYKEPVVFVRGLPAGGYTIPTAPNVTVHNHLPALQLEEVMQQASMVISRCGYSTVMDLAALHKRSILIPTPGQTEQAYLARHLTEKGFALCTSQKVFKLNDALQQAKDFAYQQPSVSEGNLPKTIQSLFKQISRRNPANAKQS